MTGFDTELGMLREHARRTHGKIPDQTVVDALQTLMATHGHTLTPEQRAAVRGWLGRVA